MKEVVMPTLVADVMTTDTAAVGAGTEIRTIAELLDARSISAVPVVDLENRVVGVVSEADVLQHRRTGRTAARIMSSPALTVRPDQPAAVAAQIIEKYGIKRLPVVDDLGRLVGIVSRSDLIHVYALGDDLTVSES
jgi:CBS domain-containing protein